MGVSVKVDVPVDKILQKRGLGKSKAAWLYAAARFKYYADPYVPFRTGHLKNDAKVVASGNGAAVVYDKPYAHYQYKGLVMGPNLLIEGVGWRSMAKPKHYTGASLSYSGDGDRGGEWDKVTMQNRRSDIINDVAKYVGGIAE